MTAPCCFVGSVLSSRFIGAHVDALGWRSVDSVGHCLCFLVNTECDCIVDEKREVHFEWFQVCECLDSEHARVIAKFLEYKHPVGCNSVGFPKRQRNRDTGAWSFDMSKLRYPRNQFVEAHHVNSGFINPWIVCLRGFNLVGSAWLVEAIYSPSIRNLPPQPRENNMYYLDSRLIELIGDLLQASSSDTCILP